MHKRSHMVAERVELSVEQMNLQPAVYKNADGSRRASRRIITSVECAKSNEQQGENDKKKVYFIKSSYQTEDEEHVQHNTAEHIVDVEVTHRRVFVMNDCDELIPEWLNVVKGVVVSENLPLNIYRETLLRNKILRVIKKSHVTKYLEMLAEIAEQKDDRNEFYEEFVKCMKLENVELLKSNTFKPGDEQISFKEYVDVPRVQKTQKTMEDPQVQYIDQIVDLPVVMQCQIPAIQAVQKAVEVPQVQFIDRMDGHP